MDFTLERWYFRRQPEGRCDGMALMESLDEKIQGEGGKDGCEK
jgi:hypothetical protein